MAENEMREPYEQPELTKLGSLRELTAEQCWECQGSVPFDPFA
ncbi:MAG: lasso RiPP family leader peptide-containing protein [Thermoleophilia bacterium]